jgi:hypothetical protein
MTKKKDPDSPFTAENREPKAMVSLNGTAITQGGKITKSNYFRFLQHDLDRYDDIKLSPEQAKKIHSHLQKLSTGSAAMTPMYCGGFQCPFQSRCPLVQTKHEEDPEKRGDPIHGKAPLGRQCHKSGDLIWTTTGYIKIEDLDSTKHSLVGYELKRNAIRRGLEEDKIGFAFQKASRHYLGLMHKISVGAKQTNITSNHICLAKWNNNALNKFCVYLMRKGNYWRIGKSRIVGYSSSKYHMPFAHRAYKEKADALWILGVYNTNTEALLAEEEYSILLQTSKACFVESFQQLQKEQIKEDKHNGMYRWATTKQLEKHHRKFIKPDCFYAKKLSELGLSIDFPIWEACNTSRKKGEVKLYTRNTMLIHACNLIPDIMDLPVKPEYMVQTLHQTKSYYEAEWQSFSKEDSFYDGIVYSLEVDGL